jgi:hypothetical protein
MRFICIVLLSLFLGSCAAVARGDPETYRVGDLEVRLYQDQDKLARDLPLLLTLINATKIGDRQLRILGYYDKQKRRIYAIDDARIVIHEFKHYLEPDWRHGIGVGRLQGLQAQAEPDLVECGVSDLQEDALSASRGVLPYAPALDLWQELEAVEETVDDVKSYTDQ